MEFGDLFDIEEKNGFLNFYLKPPALKMQMKALDMFLRRGEFHGGRNLIFNKVMKLIGDNKAGCATKAGKICDFIEKYFPFVFYVLEKWSSWAKRWCINNNPYRFPKEKMLKIGKFQLLKYKIINYFLWNLLV